MDAIGIRTPGRGADGHVEHLDFLAVVKLKVHLRAILYGNVSNNHVHTSIKLHSLQLMISVPNQFMTSCVQMT